MTPKKKKGRGRPKTKLRDQSLWHQRVDRGRKLERRLEDRLAGRGADGASLLEGTGPGRADREPVGPRPRSAGADAPVASPACTQTPCRCYSAPYLGRAVRAPTADPRASVRFGEVLKYACSTDTYHVLFEDDGVEKEVPMSPEDVDRALIGSGKLSRRPYDVEDSYVLPHGRRIVWVLDVFCGTKSVRRALWDILERSDIDYRILHLDIDDKRAPDLLCDVRFWKEELVGNLGFEPGDFDIIWISPDCRKFSRAGHPTDKELAEARKLAKCGLDIIKYFGPSAWFIENPRGRLREQRIMRDFAHLLLTCSYCCYHPFGLFKPTDIWTNVPGIALDFCCRSTPCSWMKQGYSRHRRGSQRGPSATGTPGSPLDMAQHIPHALMAILMSAAVAFTCHELRQERRPSREKGSRPESRGRRWMREACKDDTDHLREVLTSLVI